jgi:hypothetical protein
MSVSDVATGVLAGNLLTAMFIYGAIQFTKAESRGEWSWFLWGCCVFPLGMLILGLAASSSKPPPFLDALSAQKAPAYEIQLEERPAIFPKQ